jgi:hypothetical protein
MDYKYSETIQQATNTFFGKVNNSDIPKTNQNLDAFFKTSDASIHPRFDSECNQLHAGFDLGVRYAQERIDAKLNGKPLPDLWMTCAPETNHFFIGSEESVLQRIIDAAKNLELESCICSAMTLFSHGCQCSKEIK